MKQSLQWGGRFREAADPALLAFGSSFSDDLPLAPFDVDVSIAHVASLRAGGVIDDTIAGDLTNALQRIAAEIAEESFIPSLEGTFEDIHGAIDARVRAIAGDAGDWLHAGRSRNDQVATTLALYAAERARNGARLCSQIAASIMKRAESALETNAVLAATTHGQPAQPVLLAFWFVAVAAPLVRAVKRFRTSAGSAMHYCPLGSGAVAGSTLPLDRKLSSSMLGFERPSINALDAIGNRDAVLDVAHAYARAAVDVSRISAELIVWATPAFGYVTLGDRSSTGSSLMPQKRNPDIFELVRGATSELTALYCGALGTLTGLPPSYYRDLQQTKRMTLGCCERGAALLDAFLRAFEDITFNEDAMAARATLGFTTATDVADALILSGVSARDAHARVGAMVARAESEASALEDAPDARTSVAAKITIGSTSPSSVRAALDALQGELEEDA